MIEVQQLTKVYGTTRAVDRVDFHVGAGEIVGFLGPNGAGKSTTMRILCGSLGATHGVVRIGGRDVTEHPRETKRMVGYLPEIPPVYPEMTVQAYLDFCARLKGARDPEARVRTVLRQVDLESVAHRVIGHLSKGYRQRVGIAQALVHEPKVLVLDEPTSGLDPAQRVEIRQLVQELSQGDVTVVLSTHVLPEVEAICDRVLILHQGRIVAEDSVEALSGFGAHRIRVQLARPEPAVVEIMEALEGVREVTEEERGRYRLTATDDVREALASAVVGYGLLELTEQRALEDAYLRLTGGAP